MPDCFAGAVHDSLVRATVQEIRLLRSVSFDRNIVQFCGACLQPTDTMMILEFMAVSLPTHCALPLGSANSAMGCVLGAYAKMPAYCIMYLSVMYKLLHMLVVAERRLSSPQLITSVAAVVGWRSYAGNQQ